MQRNVHMKGKILSSLKTCRKAVAVACKKVNLFSILAATAIMSTPVMQAEAVDLFKGGKTTIQDTFGSGSTIIWILYTLEILACIFTYIKTKNLAMFASVAAVLVFVNVAFGVIPQPK